MSKVRRGSDSQRRDQRAHWDGTWGSECRVIEGEREEKRLWSGRGQEAL